MLPCPCQVVWLPSRSSAQPESDPTPNCGCLTSPQCQADLLLLGWACLPWRSCYSDGCGMESQAIHLVEISFERGPICTSGCPISNQEMQWPQTCFFWSLFILGKIVPVSGRDVAFGWKEKSETRKTGYSSLVWWWRCLSSSTERWGRPSIFTTGNNIWFMATIQRHHWSKSKLALLLSMFQNWVQPQTGIQRPICFLGLPDLCATQAASAWLWCWQSSLPSTTSSLW